MTTYLNIWLARDGQPDLAISEVHDVLLANLIRTYEFELQSSVTEATVVVTITSHAPSHEVLVNVAKMLDQDCIAAFDGEDGALLGPNAEAWGPFDLSQFLFPKARDERLAAREAARIAENAKRVRSALDTAFGEYEAIAGGLGLHGMRGYQREAIISVSNLDDAFLHRVAAILGCD